MHIPSTLESPGTDLATATATGFGSVGPSYVTSPKVLELPEPDHARRVALGWLGLIVTAGLLLRLLMFVLGPAAGADRAMTDTSGLRAHLAANLLIGKTFGYDPAQAVAMPTGTRAQLIDLRASAGQLETPIGPLQPEVHEMPGYALALGLVHTLGGQTSWLLLGQCILSVLAAALVYALVLNLTNRPTAGLIAAAVVAIHPALVVAPLTLNDDILFVVLLLIGLHGASKRTTPMAILGGLALSAAVLVRPVSIFIGPAIALWMVLGDRKATTVGCAFALAVMSLAGPALWMGRNATIGFGPRLSAQPTARLARTAAIVDAQVAGIAPPAPGTLPPAFATDTGAPDLLTALDTASRQSLLDHPLELGTVLSRSVWHLLTDHQADTLYRATGLTYHPGGIADALRDGTIHLPAPDSSADSAGYLSAGWMILNGLLMLTAMLGIATMTARRQGSLLLLVVAALAYLSLLTAGSHAAAWQPVALIFAAIAGGALFARGPERPRVPKVKKPRKDRGKNRDDQVFDLQEQPETATPAASRPGLAARPI